MNFVSSIPGSRTSAMALSFGRTHVVKPKGRHQATIVWLHGLGDNGSSWAQLLEGLPLPSIKWICPTAPLCPVSLFGGFPSTAWFDVKDLTEDAPDDLVGLDAAAAHVANLLSTEPNDIKLGVGGFSMGAAGALYTATCHLFGQFSNRNPFTVNLNAVVGLSGWLPCSKIVKERMSESNEIITRASSFPILMCHGIVDDVVAYKHGEKSALLLQSSGFQNLTFKSYPRLGHYTIPEETEDICRWLTEKLSLQES